MSEQEKSFQLTEKEASRFWKKVDRKSEGECWPWLGSKSGAGYGSMYLRGKSVRAHRISWSIYHQI